MANDSNPYTFDGVSAIPGFGVIGLSVYANPPGDTSGVWFEVGPGPSKWTPIVPKVSFVVYVGDKNAT